MLAIIIEVLIILFLTTLLLFLSYKTIKKENILEYVFILIITLIMTRISVISKPGLLIRTEFVFIFTMINFILTCLIRKKKFNLFMKYIFAIAIICFLEISVFNIRHYTTMFNEPYEVGVKVENDSKEVIVESNEFDKEIDNFYIDINNDKVREIDVFIRDEGDDIYFKAGTTRYNPNVVRSKYTIIHPNGKVKQIRLKIKLHEAANIKVNKLTLNANIPLSINIVRMFILITIITICFLFRTNSILYRIKLSNRLLIIPLLLVELALLIVFVVNSSSNDTNMNQYNELTVSLLKGNVYVEENKSSILENMDNPYDSGLRGTLISKHYNYEFDSLFTREKLFKKIDEWFETNKIAKDVKEEYKWDYSYYKGKYYVYFGIGPVLTAYLPYRLITGNDLNNHTLIYIMCFLTAVSFMFLIYEICKKYFKNVSIGLYYLITFTAINSIGIIGILSCPTFYTIPIIYSLFFSITGITLILNAYDSKTKSTYLKIFLGGLCLSFVSLCRPQYLITTLIVLPFLIDRFIKNDNIGNIRKIIEIVLFGLPYVVIGIGCCYYNYIRFDSILEFGASYQLTVSDITHTSKNIDKMFIGIYHYLLSPINHIDHFPYLTWNNYSSNYVGYIAMEYMYGGTFITHMITIFSLLIFKFRKNINKLLYRVGVISLISAFIIVIFDTILGGLVYRYSFDYIYLLYIPSIITILGIVTNMDKEEKLKFLKLIIILSFLGFTYDILITFTGANVFNDVNNSTIFHYAYYLLIP